MTAGPSSAPAAGFVHRRIVEPILALLRQGISPEKLALSLAFGFGLGIFPVFGATTLLCAVAAVALRLNLPAIQLVNYLTSPVQLVLIIPFVRVGEHLVGAPPQPLTIKAGLALLAAGVLNAVSVLRGAIVHAMIGWLLIGPVVIYVLYRLLRPVLARAAPRPRA
ncbi:MAG TPA: DUF2062 domain-containing protein [Steroidobacteraceae bacterium]